MEQFFTKSDQIQNIIKGFNLTKTLFVSSIIIGEANIGKKSLARYLFPQARLVSGKNQKEVEAALEEHEELIITDFEKLNNQESLDFDNKRIIATANFIGNFTTIDNLFAFIYTMPSLKERPEDAAYIKEHFVKKAQHDLLLDEKVFDIAKIPMDLSNNSKSMKKAIYEYLMIHSMDKQHIEEAVYHYIMEHIGGNNAYKEHLELYEKPLIEAGLKKYGSQLQLSQVLGINRNTLRKKIHEHAID
ncbi:helix-turn-helix domain-containing protein [Sulfurovum riftiae]|uniref:Fis family transcriptional regulator n=1 Tax=Sulfurovum riftiae TaxID=1630136 RepID=A0A151CIZ1_9BACT|nr:helix-turn-helix domain-containing protein [Sulfurovum riftiae]KYJ87495.1 Fis family transcriptional regulator [Sulfurovum riftiae]